MRKNKNTIAFQSDRYVVCTDSGYLYLYTVHGTWTDQRMGMYDRAQFAAVFPLWVLVYYRQMEYFRFDEKIIMIFLMLFLKRLYEVQIPTRKCKI